MTTRISNLAANNHVLNFIFATQKRLRDVEVQVASGKESQDYKGISLRSQRLLNIETKRDRLEKYIANNTTMEMRLNTAATTLDGVEEVIKQFRSQLSSFKQEDDFSQQSVEQIQQNAHNALIAMDAYLSTEVDGRYLFGGSRTSRAPVDLGLSSLSAFQSTYDGESVVYPVTRDAHLASETTLTNSDTGNVTFAANQTVAQPAGVVFDDAADTITLPSGADMYYYAAGMSITVANSDNNDGVYTIASVDPTTRTLTLSGSPALTSETDSGALDITVPAGSVTATNENAFRNIPVGARLTVSGSASNDDSYTVVGKSADGTRLTLAGNVGYSADDTTNNAVEVNATVAAEAGASGVSFTMSSWYKGDNQDLTHRVDENRSFEYDIKASDPAFEKAIRAMGMIAQGQFGTSGGLDNADNQGRVNQALYLLDSALKITVAGDTPLGDETVSGNFNESLEEMVLNLGFDQVLLQNTNAQHESLAAFFDARIADIENVDTLDAISRLLNEEQALEAAYQATARIRQLSLADYL